MNFTAIVVLSFLILTSCCAQQSDQGTGFQVQYQWNFINFTWPSPEVYDDAISTRAYVPGNNAMAGIKWYKDTLYIAIPRICEGNPVTLGYISTAAATPTEDPLISPFPDWETNDLSDQSCDKLTGVQSMEINYDGIMWVLDGYRGFGAPDCPPRLVLFDLNNNNSIVHTYNFPEEVCSSRGGFLNDIVIDNNEDGTFAYITDTGSDPGLIIYSLDKDKAWKITDDSMLGEEDASGFIVDGVVSNGLTPVDGIALSPWSLTRPRYVYYCALTALSLYSIPTSILKDEELCSGDDWKANITLIGQKQAQSDGMTADNGGNLYYGLLPLYGVGRWYTEEDFSESEIIDENNSTMIWTDSFAFDTNGYIYLLANNIDTFFGTQCRDNMSTDQIKFRVLKHYTATYSYLYS